MKKLTCSFNINLFSNHMRENYIQRDLEFFYRKAVISAMCILNTTMDKAEQSLSIIYDNEDGKVFARVDALDLIIPVRERAA